MFRIALGLILSGLLASPSAAGLVRVEVTGNVSGIYAYQFSIDKSDDLNWVDLGSGSIDLAQVPEGTIGARFAGITSRTTGSFLFSSEGRFSECTGFFEEICGPTGSPVYFPEQFAFDETLDIFEYEASFILSAYLRITPGGFRYADDGTDAFVVGNIQYLIGNPIVQGTFTSMTVTAVPLPAAAPLLLAGLGGLIALRRRARTA